MFIRNVDDISTPFRRLLFDIFCFWDLYLLKAKHFDNFTWEKCLTFYKVFFLMNFASWWSGKINLLYRWNQQWYSFNFAGSKKLIWIFIISAILLSDPHVGASDIDARNCNFDCVFLFFRFFLFVETETETLLFCECWFGGKIK